MFWKNVSLILFFKLVLRKTFKVSSLTKIKTLFILVVYQPWGVMKKFVNWCHNIDIIYALLSNFIKNKKKQTSKCRENWIPLRRWLILLISTNTKHMPVVWSLAVVAVEFHFFHNVIAFFLNVTLYFGRIHRNQLQT